MGAWIETKGIEFKLFDVQVAPFMGAWIETPNMWTKLSTRKSRTLHGCVD